MAETSTRPSKPGQRSSACNSDAKAITLDLSTV
jgi:hypothetical protein